jgi:hypothetical protein
MFYLSGPDAEVTAAAPANERGAGRGARGTGQVNIGLEDGLCRLYQGDDGAPARTHPGGPCVGLPGRHPPKYASSHLEALRLFTAHVTTWPEYAAIRAEERVELTATAKAAGLAPSMAPGAARVMAAMAQLGWDTNDAMDKTTRARTRPLSELIRLLAVKGLLKAPEKAA